MPVSPATSFLTIVRAGRPSGCTAILYDGWHFTYLRCQGNLAAVAFDGVEFSPESGDQLRDIIDAQPMSQARQVWADTGGGHGPKWLIIGNEVSPHWD